MNLGLRARVTLMFAAGAAALAVTGAVATYTTARSYLLGQREESATRQAFADASFVRDGLGTSGVAVSDVLGAVAAPAGAQILLDRAGQRFSTTLDVSFDDLPPALTRGVREGSTGVSWTVVAGEPVLAVGLPLPAVGADFYELSSVAELERTLTALRTALCGCALLTGLGGAGLGLWTSRRAVAPLHRVARTAAVIAGGEVGTRLPTTVDPDLATIVGSFNSMVDALEEQIEREARFSADVSHELRSPLTTLVTGVDLLRRRREELPERSRQALDLVGRELDRFARTLDDLLELASLESGAGHRERTPVDLTDLAAQVLRDRSAGDLLARPAAAVPVVVDKQQVSRAVVNLLDNADRYAGGPSGVSVQVQAGDALLVVDDEGPGVGVADRDRVFERFARAGSRGALPGAGLGLSLVAETARAHGGAVWCTASPAGGARFVLRLPLAQDRS
ncbi:ATP-binding protein [Kineococcus sp. LSe6-4]|uniref:histidine kinase n=1 Tax=Kineococcus halophytocola TaxID=3234027 RepID=A0ABV4GZT2_9ACTN